MKKDEFKQLKKEFAAYIKEIEYARGRNIYSKEVKRLARNFVLERFGMTKTVELLATDLYRHYAFDPEPKPTLIEAQTRLCEIAAGLKEIGRLELRLSDMVQKAIKEEPYLSSTNKTITKIITKCKK